MPPLFSPQTHTHSRTGTDCQDDIPLICIFVIFLIETFCLLSLFQEKYWCAEVLLCSVFVIDECRSDAMSFAAVSEHVAYFFAGLSHNQGICMHICGQHDHRGVHQNDGPTTNTIQAPVLIQKCTDSLIV